MISVHPELRGAHHVREVWEAGRTDGVCGGALYPSSSKEKTANLQTLRQWGTRFEKSPTSLGVDGPMTPAGRRMRFYEKSSFRPSRVLKLMP